MFTNVQANVIRALIAQAVIDQDESWLDTAIQYLHATKPKDGILFAYTFSIENTRKQIQRCA